MTIACGNKARAASPSPANVQEGGDDERLRLQLHSAQLLRSFAKVGIMDPYITVSVDGKEMHRSAPAKWSHKNPQWDVTYTMRGAEAPSSMTLAVWNRNRLRKDVFCGSVTVPCSADMGLLDRKEFTLTKKAVPTGTVRISLEMLGVQAPALPHAESTRTAVSALGAELDHMGSWLHDKSSDDAPDSRQLCLVEPEGAVQHEDSQDAIIGQGALTLLGSTPISPKKASENNVAAAAHLEHEQAEEKPEVEAVPEKPEDELLAVLCGSWTCIATTGLEDFLKATGVGAFQRKLAMSARWPSWDFMVSEGCVHFVNHSAMGDLKENILFNTDAYDWKDGRGNPMSCTAHWEKTVYGGVLKISRRGAIGNYSEERRVEGDTLVFTLTHESAGAVWGRTFTRKA